MTEWSGRRVQQARAVVAQWLPAPCGQCGQEVDGTEPWVVGHRLSRAEHPDLTWRVSNWQPEHRRCSDASGQAVVIAKARAEGAAAALTGSHVHESDDHRSGFPGIGSAQQSPPLPFSPPRATESPLTVRSVLEWPNATQNAPAWLLPVLAVPQDASVPLAMTPPHPDAVDSYGLDAAIWIETAFNVSLRWWQRLSLIRLLEHRDDGSLCWRTVLLSASRRSGKSLLLRGLASWRLAHAHLFGEVQTVVHTGSDVAICREVQRGAWRYAEEVAGWTVSRANGKEAVETQDGDRWLVRSQSAVYGYDACMALGDECWDIPATVIDDGLEPAMLERQSPQLVLTSTAHRRATNLMRGRIGAALDQDDGETLLLLWAARPQDNPADPATWQAASPHWSADRERTLRAKYAKALAGEADAELDDADPMAGFASQYLNRWRLNARREVKGDALVGEDAWAALVELPDDVTPDAVAVEGWPGEGVSVASAWRTGAGAVVSVSDHQDVAGAVAAVKATGFRGRVTVGASLAEDPSVRGLSVAPTSTRTTAAVQQFGRLLGEGVVSHDGTGHLTGQVLAVRTAPGADGPRLVSKGRADAVKAAAWAVASARAKRSGGMRVLLPSSA